MPGTTRAAISLCGLPVRAENVRLLAARLEGDPLALKLERALANNNSIVALSFEERVRIVEALSVQPSSLSGLRSELQAQVKRHADQAAKAERANRHREMAEWRSSLQRRATDQPA
jgi:hypothetical protein